MSQKRFIGGIHDVVPSYPGLTRERRGSHGEWTGDDRAPYPGRGPRFRCLGHVALIARFSDADAQGPRWPLASADDDVLTGLKCGIQRQVAR